MAINDVAGETVYCVWDIPREILCHNFVSDLHTLRPKKLKTFLNLFFPARICTIQHGCFCESDDLLTTLQKSMSGWTWKIHLVIWSILSLNFIDSKSTFFMQSWHLVLLCPCHLKLQFVGNLNQTCYALMIALCFSQILYNLAQLNSDKTV